MQKAETSCHPSFHDRARARGGVRVRATENLDRYTDSRDDLTWAVLVGRRGACAAMMRRLLAVGSMVHSVTLSYSQLPALRGFPEGPAEVAHHRTLGRLLGDSRDEGDATVQVFKQALERYRDIQSHTGAGIVDYE